MNPAAWRNAAKGIRPDRGDRGAALWRENAMTPEEILEAPHLTPEAKADLLCAMSYDAAEQAVALEEGMPGGDEDLQRRVLLALTQLHRGMDVEHTGPTKQHSSCLK
jgi:hypothetical protein